MTLKAGARQWGGRRLAFTFFGTALLGSLFLLLFYSGFVAVRTLKHPPDLSILNSTPALRAKMKIQTWLPLSEMSVSAVDAIVISEDGGFYSHKAYDLSSIRDAVKTDIRSLKFRRGASTITQQVMKNLFLSREKTITRKIEELVLAQEAEKRVRKDRLLEIYLNTAQFGTDLYGLEAASGFYFHRRASELTAKEGAFLAMLLPNPVRYQRSFRDRKLTPYADRTITSILLKLVEAGKMKPEEFNEEMAKPLNFEAAQDGNPAGEGQNVTPTPSPQPEENIINPSSAVRPPKYQRLPTETKAL